MIIEAVRVGFYTNQQRGPRLLCIGGPSHFVALAVLNKCTERSSADGKTAERPVGPNVYYWSAWCHVMK